MSTSVLVGVAVLGGLGAVGRFLLDGAVQERVDRSFPYGTLAVNLSGSLLLGLLVGLALGRDGQRLLGTGLIGAYTTFSTWTFESQRLREDRQLDLTWANLLVSLGLGVAAAALGRHLGAAL